jgi:uncharacterized delta-60 repeat protein
MKKLYLPRVFVLASSLLLQLSTLCFNCLGAPGDVDLSFDPGSGVDGVVNDMVVQPDGKVIIGGNFRTVKGLARGAIARLNSDGSGDPSFNAGDFAAYGYAYVSDIALQADGKVLVGGYFGIVRLNPDGSRDTNFNANLYSDYCGCSGYVDALAVQPDGKVLIGGQYLFTSSGTNLNSTIARLNPDGSLDDSFNAGFFLNGNADCIEVQPDGKVLVGGEGLVRFNSDGSVDRSFDLGVSQIITVVAQSDGKVLVGGWFNSVNGTNRNTVARLNVDGSLDNGFAPNLGPTNVDYLTVNTIVVQSDGKLLIGGSFTTVNGTNRTRIARLNADGSLDSNFNPGTGADGTVNCIALLPDSKVLIGGWFTMVNSTNRNRVGRLQVNGSVDSGFDPGRGVETAVSSLVVQSDGKVLIGGVFTFVNGTNRYGSARLNTDGSLDSSFISGTNFNPDFSGINQSSDCPPGYNCYGRYLQPMALAVQLDGKVLISGYTVITACDPYEGGCIDIYGFFLIRVNADGSIDPSFERMTDGPVQAVLVQPDGKIVLGGAFYLVKGVIRSGVARLNSNGSLDANFASSTGVYDVSSLALQADGSIIAANAYAIVRIGPNGGRETCFNPETDGAVSSLKVQADGKILVGGNFSTVNGVTRKGIARINTNGSLDSSFNPGSGADGVVSSMALQPDGNVLVGGGFVAINGIARPHVARLFGGAGFTAASPLRVFSATVNTVTVAWPSSSSGVTLQQNTSLTTPNWVNVPNAPATIGLEKQVTISTTGQGFFRMSAADPAPPPAPAPTSVVATVGDGLISLSWAALPEATGHHVLRGTNYGGPFTVIASPGTTNYTDTSVVNGSLYYYVVSVTYPCGESFTSAPPVGGIPHATPPTVHVQSITMSFVAQGSRYYTRAVVKIVDNTGTPVNGATVAGNFTGSINNAGRTGNTVANGEATITSSSTIKNGTVTFTVTNVAAAMNYNAAANVVTSASISR